MEHIALTTRCIAAGIIVIAACSCSSDDDDTLAPLPIAGATVPTRGASVPAAVVTSTVASRTVASGPAEDTTVEVDAPTGDWDGARFDVGTIESVATLGAYTSIELDRLSYVEPGGRRLDASALDAEPVVAWWHDSPFDNERTQTRTFVLDPDVEVLTLDPAGRARACAEPPPANVPKVVWDPSGTSALGSIADGDVAVLTYSDAGLVTRIRLTRGC